ncbi:hypothetical protein ACQ5SO_11055 [Rhodovulum sp. DZ06]|uniref:hypothetical protein n=1 Tax=Rhodovulum sp. DZ06 TaxID=3425126 RepID=UPI003D34818F
MGRRRPAAAALGAVAALALAGCQPVGGGAPGLAAGTGASPPAEAPPAAAAAAGAATEQDWLTASPAELARRYAALGYTVSDADPAPFSAVPEAQAAAVPAQPAAEATQAAAPGADAPPIPDDPRAALRRALEKAGRRAAEAGDVDADAPRLVSPMQVSEATVPLGADAQARAASPGAPTAGAAAAGGDAPRTVAPLTVTEERYDAATGARIEAPAPDAAAPAGAPPADAQVAEAAPADPQAADAAPAAAPESPAPAPLASPVAGTAEALAAVALGDGPVAEGAQAALPATFEPRPVFSPGMRRHPALDAPLPPGLGWADVAAGLLRQREYDPALTAYRRDLVQRGVERRNILGTVAALRGLGRYGQARRVLEKAAQRWPEDPMIRNNLGVLLHEARLYADAERELRIAARLIARDPAAADTRLAREVARNLDFLRLAQEIDAERYGRALRPVTAAGANRYTLTEDEGDQ